MPTQRRLPRLLCNKTCTKLNAHFGDLAALRTLVAHAHDRDMKVVLDIVCNHMGQVFFYDINKSGRPDDYVNGSNRPGDPIVQISEYDPPWQPGGVLSFSQEGTSGRAPMLFFDDPAINRLPPPGVFGTAGAYHGRIGGHDRELRRRGATHARRFYRRPERSGN